MNRLPEILAPAGSPEALRAAVRCGADAVYLGASAFNARQGAHNFDTAALREAVSYCHARGVAVHLTLNTLVRQDELHAALKVAEEACVLGVDALIVQDVGLARRIRAAAPGMALHASTQLSCHTPSGVRFLRDSGFSRVVLAREMSRDEIAACAGQGCELEVFVHGALCMCVSGQCYLSAMLGGRSGNRGLCAQPCRLPFVPADSGRRAREGEAALSLRDLSLQAYGADLAALGVDSLKIEGRLKRPEYVAAAVSVYRAAVRGEAPAPGLSGDLQAVFSRSGFTDGYYADQRGGGMFGTRRREDVQAAAPVLSRLERLYDKETGRVPVTLTFAMTADEATLTAADGEGRTVTVTGDPPQPAVNRPLDAERAAAQLGKTGGTPFRAAVHCRMDEGLSLPLSQLNAMRRQALEQLLEERGRPRPVPFNREAVPERRPALADKPARPLLIARLARPDQLAGAGEADRVFLPLSVPEDLLRRHAEDGRLGVEIPRGLFGAEEAARRALARAAQAGARYALCGNVGTIDLAREAGLLPVGGFGLNITNGEALAFFADRGLAAATLSMELTFRQTAFAADRPLPVGLLVYGRQPLMLTRNCPRRSAGQHCEGAPNAACGLTDRRGVTFPLACAGGCAELLNSVPLYWADRLEEVPRLDFWLLHFSTESPEEVENLTRAYHRGGAAMDGITRGLYKRGVE